MIASMFGETSWLSSCRLSSDSSFSFVVESQNRHERGLFALLIFILTRYALRSRWKRWEIGQPDLPGW